MADGYLEDRMHDFEMRRDAYKQQRTMGKGRKHAVTRQIQRPDDEAL